MLEPGDPALPSAPSSVPPLINPMTFGQALDRVFRLLKTHSRVFLSIASIPAAVYAVFLLFFFGAVLVIAQPWQRPDPAKLAMHMGLLMTAMLIGEVVMLVAYALYQPAASYAALQADAGVEISFRDAYGRAWSKFGRYVWLMILKWLIMAAPIFLFALIVGGGAAVALHGNSHIDTGTVFLLFPLILLLYAVVGIYIIVALIWLAFSYPACIQENLTAAGSIGRSVKLTKGARGRIFLLAAVIYAISYAVALVVECLIAAVAGVVLLAGMALHLAMNPWGFIGIGIAAICLVALMFFWMACTWAAYSTAFAVLYRNQRLCREGILPAPLTPVAERLAP